MSIQAKSEQYLHENRCEKPAGNSRWAVTAGGTFPNQEAPAQKALMSLVAGAPWLLACTSEGHENSQCSATISPNAMLWNREKKSLLFPPTNQEEDECLS